MLFNSLSFAVFLPIVFFAFWLCPQKYRWCVLLVSSYYFYMSWNAKYVVLIFLATFISYAAALLISKEEKQALRKVYLSAAAFVSLGILFVFKYFNFFGEIAASFLRFFKFEGDVPVLDVLLPVGISFYTFQSIGYVIDVYRKAAPAETHFGKYATFVSFFPQLVAGPIERTSNLLPQIKKAFSLDYTKAAYGLKLMAWGYFKKIVIADTLAQYVDSVYSNPSDYAGFVFILVTVMFGIQIYCDFSGYSDIAIGVAKLFDIDLMQNFASPYFSASIKEFWSRWHISLSSWFRDYVYIPLGGNRCSKWKYWRNLLITFLVSGLWHGAAWNFVIWGFLHGLAQVAEAAFSKDSRRSLKNNRSPKTWLSVLFVFAFTMFAWFFFRVSSLESARIILQKVFVNIQNPLTYLSQGFKSLHIRTTVSVRLSVMVGLLLTYDYFSLKQNVIEKISALPAVARWSIYLGFSFLTLLLYPPNSGGEFIYFQF